MSNEDDWFDSEDFDTGSDYDGEEEVKEGDGSMELNDRKPR